MILLKIIDRLKESFIKEKHTFIAFYDNHIYIVNYDKILEFSNEYMKVRLDKSIFIFYGNNLKIIRKSNIELDIYGTFISMEKIDE